MGREHWYISAAEKEGRIIIRNELLVGRNDEIGVEARTKSSWFSSERQSERGKKGGSGQFHKMIKAGTASATSIEKMRAGGARVSFESLPSFFSCLMGSDSGVLIR